jgi:hypothetical protein
MTVEFAKEPKGCRAALEKGLQALAAGPTPATQNYLAAVSGADAPPPLPVYVLPLDQVAAGNFRSKQKPIAWQYLLVKEGRSVGAAEVQTDLAKQRKGFIFAAISTAPAAGIANAIELAEKDHNIVAGRYEMRLVRIPAIYVAALWLMDLSGNKDMYVATPPSPNGLQALAAIPGPEFFKLLRAMATVRLQAASRRSRGSATN